MDEKDRYCVDVYSIMDLECKQNDNIDVKRMNLCRWIWLSGDISIASSHHLKPFRSPEILRSSCRNLPKINVYFDIFENP